MYWINNDGLKVRFDHEKITRVEGGQYNFGGSGNVTIEVEMNAADIGTTATLMAEGVIVPRNFFIEQVEVVSETALTALTSLDFGLQRLDFTTELDYDGLVNDIVLASLNVDGEKTVLTAGVATAGALVGTETLYPGRLVATRVGTAGVGRVVLRVRGHVKDVDTNFNNY